MKQKFNGLLTLILVLITQITFAQDMTVSGVVSDANGMPIAGANVKVKGTSTGTQTDFDGAYKIKAKSSDVLVYSFTGMNSQELKVSGAKMNARLSPKATELDGVVVTSMGIKKKSGAITSSYSTVSNKDLKSAANPDVIRSLAGKVSGITVSGTSNGVNGTNSIRIRSMLSITGSTEALVVIDDVISTADVLGSLPSDAIQSVTVLKGAQGAALYGTQGKQGVVLVQTKRGSKSEKLSVSFNSGVDIENISFVPQKQQKYGQGWFNSRDPQENGGWGELFDGVVGQVGVPLPDGSIITAPYSSRGDDNIKDFYNTGFIFQNNLNFNLGGKDSYVNLNIGNLRRNFILEGDNLNRNTILLSAGKKINKFNLGGSVLFTNQNTKQADINSPTTRSDYTLLTNLLQGASNIPINEFRNRGLYGWNGYFQNPFWAKDNNRLNQDKNTLNIGLKTDYELSKNINLSYNGSIQFNNNNQIQYSNAGALLPGLADGGTLSSPSQFYQSTFSQTYYYGDLMANFNYDLSDKVGMKLVLGENMQYTDAKRISQGGINLEIPGFYNITNVLSPEAPYKLKNNQFITKSIATYANLDLNYEDYLFMNATARYEGNSVGAKGNQFFFYPSLGFSYVATKGINSLKDNNTLSLLKFYGNYSLIGSLDPISPYQISDLGNFAANFPFPNTGNSFQNSSSPTNASIKPETYTTIEGGVNFGFFKDKLTLDIAGYKTNTKDLITQGSYSTATGLQYYTTNSGELEAKGFEIDLGFTPFNTEKFKWNGRISLSTYDTKVLSTGGLGTIVLYDAGNSPIQANIAAVEGQSFPYITGTDWTKDGNGNVIVDAKGMPTATSTFGNLGKVLPDYVLGFTNNFEYKGIGLSLTMDYRTGGSFISQTKYNLTWNGHLVDSAEFDRNTGFLFPNSVIESPVGSGTYIPNTSVMTAGNYNAGSTGNTIAYYGRASNLGAFNLIDATALRIREIALSYSLSKKLLGNTGIDSFKISFNARNPFLWLADSNKGYADPEATNQNNSETSSAGRTAAGTLTNISRNGIGFIGDGQYPSTRTFGFSINTTF